MSATDCPTCGLDPEDFACPDPCHRSELSKLRDAVEWLGGFGVGAYAQACRERLFRRHLAINPCNPVAALIAAHEEASKQ